MKWQERALIWEANRLAAKSMLESESLNERHSTVRARAGVCKVTDSVGESDGRVAW
jgi:hypothetical protein